MTTIKQIISTKGSDVTTVKPDTDAIAALKTMAEMHIGSLLVIDHGKVVGIMSEKDFAYNVVLKDRIHEHVPVSEVMTTPVVAIKPEQSVNDGMNIMTEKRIRHLPVMRDGEVVGLVSIGDLVKAIINEQQSTIKQLENYIYC